MEDKVTPAPSWVAGTYSDLCGETVVGENDRGGRVGGSLSV